MEGNNFRDYGKDAKRIPRKSYSSWGGSVYPSNPMWDILPKRDNAAWAKNDKPFRDSIPRDEDGMPAGKAAKRTKDNGPLMRTKNARREPRERLISNYAAREYSNQMPWEFSD